MISDSPYHRGDLALPPLVGLLGGVVGSVLMIVSIIALESVSSVHATDLLLMLSPFGTGIIGGVIMHLIIGGVLGLLYALSEQRGTPGALLFVGLFYGFVMWVVSAVLVGAFLGEGARAVLRTLPFLIACLIFGVWLALLSIWSDSLKPATTSAVPKD